jgi:hypothetical protein
MRDLDGTGVHIFMGMREAEASGGKAYDAEQYQDNSNDGGGFHLLENLSWGRLNIQERA